MDQSKQLEVPKPKIDEQGRQYVTTYECLRKTARADVTVRLPGTGKISINGQDISYFSEEACREQVSGMMRETERASDNLPDVFILL